MRRQTVEPTAVLGIDGAGYIVRRASAALIQPQWRPPLEWTIAAYQERFGPALRSIYVRGSVPLGTARDGQSDMDTFAIIENDESRLDAGWAKSLNQKVHREWPFVAAVEALTFPTSAVGTSGWLAATIKTQSACLHGNDLAKDMPGFRPGIDMVFAAWNLPRNLAIARHLIATLDDPEAMRATCHWATKCLIRSAFELVMKRAQCYTRDLHACCEIFTTYYPVKALSLAKAMAFALERGMPAHFGAVVDDLGDWLYGEICLTYGAERMAQICERET